MKALGRTHKGYVRDQNQDSLYCCTEAVGSLPNMFIIADGMGGHQGGAYASSFAVEQFIQYIKQNPSVNIPQLLEDGIVYINHNIYSKAKDNKALYGMGTTFVVSTIVNDKIYVANVGDSRLYILNSTINQITSDHSFVEELVKRGKISQEEAYDHPDKNIITRAVGLDQDVVVDSFVEKLNGDDFILLCSDGLTNMIKDEIILSIVKESHDIDTILDQLMQLALKNGGKDNISAILVKGMR